jgi:hypothetical protein
MRRTAATLLIVSLLAACASEPGLPGGIDEPAWPTDAEGWAAVLEAMPDEIEDLPRQEGGILVATYGDPGSDETVRVYADDLGGAECPGLFGTTLLRSILEEGGDLKVEESSPDGAEDPTYLFGSRPDGTKLAAWTVPDCRWVVVVEAPTVALRDAGVEATVAAASG